MHRFFADSKDISQNSIKLSDEDFKHIRTLRLRPDEHFIVCDGNGTDYTCKLGSNEKHGAVQIVGCNLSTAEPTVNCKLFIAFSKGDRLDYAIQKSVELGVTEILLFESERCVAVPNDIPKKVTRLSRIALETAKLCGRGIIPAVSYAGDFTSAVENAVKSSDLTLFFYESEEKVHIKSILQQYFHKPLKDKKYEISIITGPEGGFALHEVDYARSKGIPIITLGPRILRSETAPVVALAAIMYQTDNM